MSVLFLLALPNIHMCRVILMTPSSPRISAIAGKIHMYDLDGLSQANPIRSTIHICMTTAANS